MRRALLILLCCLAGCVGAPPPLPSDTRPVESNVDAAAPAEVLDAVLRGQILLPDAAPLAAGSRLQLQLVHRFDPTRPVLAVREQAIEGATPLRFELPFQRAAVDDISVYRLEVSLFNADGRLSYVSDGEHPVNLGPEAEPTRLVLMAVDPGNTRQHSFDCGGSRLQLEFVDPDLLMQLDGSHYRLRRAHAASGIRYSGADAEFWQKGDQARLQIGARSLSCQRLAD